MEAPLLISTDTGQKLRSHNNNHSFDGAESLSWTKICYLRTGLDIANGVGTPRDLIRCEDVAAVDPCLGGDRITWPGCGSGDS